MHTNMSQLDMSFSGNLQDFCSRSHRVVTLPPVVCLWKANKPPNHVPQNDHAHAEISMRTGS